MTNEEMIQKYYDGNESMLEKLYNKNIGFIHSIAKESAAAFNCFNKNENRPQELTVYTKEILSELDSEGTLAFFDCIQSRKYDATKAKLTTYLYPHIKGAMYRWLEKNVGAVSLSKHDMNTIRKVQKMYYEDYKEVAEIADELKLSETTVEKYINYNTHSLSVEDIVPDNSDSFIESLLLEETSTSTDRLVQQKLCLELLEKQFNKLSDKDKYILGHSTSVFGYEKKTLDEIALVEMMTIDGVIKARKSIIRKLIKTGRYND
ncbi:MAG: hypothetical protein ACI4F2_03785 [Acutalibacteraceae bacterium]